MSAECLSLRENFRDKGKMKFKKKKGVRYRVQCRAQYFAENIIDAMVRWFSGDKPRRACGCVVSTYSQNLRRIKKKKTAKNILEIITEIKLREDLR